MTFIVTLEQGDIVWLAWAAGFAQGAGNTGASDSLTGIVNRVVPVEETTTGYPEDRFDDPTDAELEAWEAELETAVTERAPDPRFTPPVVPGRDFEGGAGPPPGLPQ